MSYNSSQQVPSPMNCAVGVERKRRKLLKKPIGSIGTTAPEWSPERKEIVHQRHTDPMICHEGREEFEKSCARDWVSRNLTPSAVRSEVPQYLQLE